MSPPASAPVAIPVDISRIIKYAPEELIGREAEMKLLADAWQKATRDAAKRPHILTFVALGGEGKTSLVSRWAVDLQLKKWPGCDAVFAWSFYSQGTREQTAVSSDSFLAEALKFFGDEAMANSAASAFDKGRRLAKLVGEQRVLLILDGVEPLQYAPASPTAGELKDQAVSALLKGLAANSKDLCVVTTRYAIPDLRAYRQTTAPMHELPRLSMAAGVRLLQTIGVQGSLRKDIKSEDGRELFNEYEKLVEDVDGHALTLQIIGQFLVRAFQGDIRRRDRIDIQKADERIQGGHAFRAMAAYVTWLENDSEESRREVAVLQLLGLFDRPATADCIAALRAAPVISGLTEPLVGLAEEDWQFSLSSLKAAKLISVQGEGSSLHPSSFSPHPSIDAHPLLREYFGKRLREHQPEAWRAGHRRLYQHLCATTKEGDQPTLEDLQPIYQAVAHGCHAGLYQEVCANVYFGRIKRQNENYSSRKLGAFGADLGAVVCFFEQPWSRLWSPLEEKSQAWLLSEAGFTLRALGRLVEALVPIREVTEVTSRLRDWINAATDASTLSELELTLGEVVKAVGTAQQSVTYADRSGDWFTRSVSRAVFADALRQAGRPAEAEAHFREAEIMQAENQPNYPLLYSVRGFTYCELLLAAAERAAWHTIMDRGDKQQQRAALAPMRRDDDLANALSPLLSDSALQICGAVSRRAAQTLKWEEGMRGAPIHDFALHHLILGRSALYSAILVSTEPLVDPNVRHAQQPVLTKEKLAVARSELDAGVVGLRRAGTTHHIPRGLLSRAWARSLTVGYNGYESAQADLDEAWEIAERGPMRLFMADIHLYRARLFHAVKPYPWGTDVDGHARGPKDDLAAARKLIEACGYWRRKEELEDAEAASVNW